MTEWFSGLRMFVCDVFVFAISVIVPCDRDDGREVFFYLYVYMQRHVMKSLKPASEIWDDAQREAYKID